MFKNNLTRIIFCAVAVSLFLVPSLYSKMKPVSEEDLDLVTAESGVTLGLDITASATASNVGIYQSAAQAEGLLISTLSIQDAEGDPVGVNTIVNIDVGTSGGRTWLNMSGLNFPNQTGNLPMNYDSPNGLHVLATDLQVKDSATTTYTLAHNFYLLGTYIGKNVNLWTSGTDYVNFTPGDTFMRVSNHSTSTSSGIDIIQEMGLLMRMLMIRPNTSDTRRWFVDGIILSRNNPGSYDATADPASWPNLSGSAKIGGLIPTYTYDTSNYSATHNGYKSTTATIDVGRSSGGETAIRMNLPMAMSLNWKHLYIDQGGTGAKNLDTGATLLQNVSVYKAQLTIRDIY
jgi:hypothetical protein